MPARSPSARGAFDALNASSPGTSPAALRAVVVGAGLETHVQRPDSANARVARRLARTLGLAHRAIDAPQDPQGQLQRLQGSPGGWLASLPLDPGHPLDGGGTWAEELGAWRQPALLVIDERQLPSGAAASTVALLRQWQVPLLGLVQWGGLWSPDQRRKDGLPWLGSLQEDREEGMGAGDEKNGGPRGPRGPREPGGERPSGHRLAAPPLARPRSPLVGRDRGLIRQGRVRQGKGRRPQGLGQSGRGALASSCRNWLNSFVAGFNGKV
jgi:hypothetical protein